MGNPNNNNDYTRAIKDIALADRPREKAKSKGFDALTDAELLAILIGSGTPGESVVDLCQRILRDCNNKLYELARRDIRQLARTYSGIGEVKAITILAALELARRYSLEDYEEKPTIKNSTDIYKLLRPHMEHLNHEEIWIITLNRANGVTDKFKISQGGSSSTVIDVKQILREAIQRLAEGIIIAHNHPSNNLRPSLSDDELTRSIASGCKAVGIRMLDHVIVCRSGHYSYLDNGKL